MTFRGKKKIPKHHSHQWCFIKFLSLWYCIRRLSLCMPKQHVAPLPQTIKQFSPISPNLRKLAQCNSEWQMEKWIHAWVTYYEVDFLLASQVQSKKTKNKKKERKKNICNVYPCLESKHTFIISFIIYGWKSLFPFSISYVENTHFSSQEKKKTFIIVRGNNSSILSSMFILCNYQHNFDYRYLSLFHM